MKPLLAYASTFDILGWSTAHQVNDKKKTIGKMVLTLLKTQTVNTMVL